MTYEVMKTPPAQNQLVQNFTGVTALLVVDNGNYSVTVAAFNGAGYGPAAHLSINTRRQNSECLLNIYMISLLVTSMEVLIIRETSSS